MLIRCLTVLFFAMGVGPLALGVEPAKNKPKKVAKPQAESSTASEFQIDKNLTALLYEATANEVRGEQNSKLHSSAITPQMSFVRPITMTLENSNFSVPYDRNVNSIPMVSMIVSTPRPFVTFGQVYTYAEGSVGYGYAEGIYGIESNSGLSLTDAVQLHWVPLLGSLRFEHKSAMFKPSIRTSVGGQWLSQNGQLDGMKQGFWIPAAQVGAGFTLFDTDGIQQTDFFQGVRLGVTYQQSFLSVQTISAWSIDVGSQFIL